jgi:hypothetical protein
VQRLVSALFDRWAGQPILVIGGGPSAKKDLARLDITPACVISANEHGAHQDRFKVDLVVNCDKRHCMLQRPMEEILRAALPHAAIVNRHSWADYRLGDWRFAGNSGLTAIAVAAALGGNPVIVTGIDMFHGGRVYFHDVGAKPSKQKTVRPGVIRRDKSKLTPLKQFCAGAAIRPMSGPLCEYFPQYDPAEPFKARGRVGYALRMEEEGQEVLVEAVRSFKMSNFDMIPLGHQLALTRCEYQEPNMMCNVRLLSQT